MRKRVIAIAGTASCFASLASLAWADEPRPSKPLEPMPPPAEATPPSTTPDPDSPAPSNSAAPPSSPPAREEASIGAFIAASVNGGIAVDGRSGADPLLRFGYGFRLDWMFGRGETQPLLLTRRFGWGLGPYGELSRNGLHDNIFGGGLTFLSPGIGGEDSPHRVTLSIGAHATEAGDRPYSRGLSTSVFWGLPGMFGLRAGYRHGLGDLTEHSAFLGVETNAAAVVAVPLAIVALPFIIAICAGSHSGCMPGGFVSWGPPAPVPMRDGALARLRRARVVGYDHVTPVSASVHIGDRAAARRKKGVRTASRVAGLIA